MALQKNEKLSENSFETKKKEGEETKITLRIKLIFLNTVRFVYKLRLTWFITKFQ